MLKIGLTGGIGSGKSTVARIFEVLGIPVYYADQAARDLMNNDPELKKQIIAEFGSGTFTDGQLNRAWLADQVFGNPEKLAILNSFVHPVTMRHADAWMKDQVSAYAIKEAALIFEGKLEKYFDFIIGVTAPENLRLERAVQRDHSKPESVLQRMRQQMDETKKISLCDFVIVNDEKQAILPQVLDIHKSILTKIHNEGA
jgi:dephospho-CoA kinase